MAAIKYIKRTVALDGNSISEQLPASFFNSENTAHTFIIAATRGGQPLQFPSNGNVNAVFLNERDAVVPITGSIVDGAAVVTLSNPCYELSGRFTLTIDVNGATVYECQSRVKHRSSGTAYDPDDELSVAALSAEVAAMHTATAAANAAATAADTARENIQDDLGALSNAIQDNISQLQNTDGEYTHALHFTIGYTLSSGVYRAAGNNRAATEDFYPVGMLVHFVRNDVNFFYEYDFYSDNNEAAFMEYSPKWMATNKIMEPPSGAKYFRLLLRNFGNTELSGNLDGKLSAYSISPNNVSAFYNAKYNAGQTPIVYSIDQFEYGYITGAEQTYGDVNADNASRRVRTKQGRSLHLLPGVILRLTDYDTYYMRVFGIRTDTGAHIMTTTDYHTDYTIPYEGDYSLLFGRTDNADLNAVDFVTDIFSIIYDKGHTYDYDWLFLRGINHTGYSTVAPANTLPAFKLSKTHGFHFVESDVRLTSDNVPVMIHNATIDETSDGTGNVADMTYQQLLQYDFGSWKSAEYAGTKIPSFDQYIELCRNIQLYPYIELKEIDFPETVILNMVNICKKYGMLNAVTWISYDMDQLKKVLKYDKHARVGFIASPDSLNIDTMLTVTSMKTGENRVFVDGAYGAIGNMLGLITDLNLEAEVYTLDDANYMRNYLSPRIVGATSNTLDYPEVIMERDI